MNLKQSAEGAQMISMQRLAKYRSTWSRTDPTWMMGIDMLQVRTLEYAHTHDHIVRGQRCVIIIWRLNVPLRINEDTPCFVIVDSSGYLLQHKSLKSPQIRNSCHDLVERELNVNIALYQRSAFANLHPTQRPWRVGFVVCRICVIAPGLL
jgi:hypothetical protein